MSDANDERIREKINGIIGAKYGEDICRQAIERLNLHMSQDHTWEQLHDLFEKAANDSTADKIAFEMFQMYFVAKHTLEARVN